MKKHLLVAALSVLSLSVSGAHAQSKVTVNADQTVSINGTRVFPISVYLQSDWAGVKNLGVNLASRPFCVNSTHFKNGEAAGLYMHYTAGPGCDYDNAAAIKNRNSNAFVQSVNQVRNSNFLFGYGLPDEPVSATKLSPADTQWAYGVIKAADPHHPVFITDYANDISAYKESADIFLNDQYPFNNNVNPLYDIKTKVKNMQAQVAPKPVWLIIQTGSQFGTPTNAQIRAETYLSIALGSTGIIFYSYDVEDAGGVHNIKKDGDPVFMKNLISELKNFSPVFLGARNKNLTYNASHVDAILKDHNGKSYLIAVNKSASPQAMTFTLPTLGGSTANIVGLSTAGSTRTGQTRSVSSAGALTDTLQPLEAVIYEINGKPGTGGGATTTVQAENWAWTSGGPATEPTTDLGGGQNVGWISAGNWMSYNVNIPSAGTYKLTFRVASPHSGKTLRLEKDAGATRLGTVSVPNTGGWQNWSNTSMNVTLPAGAYSLAVGTSTGDFNLNYFTIQKQ